MPALVREIDKRRDGDDILVWVRVTSLDNPLSQRGAAVRAQARGLLSAGIISESTPRLLRARSEHEDKVEIEKEQVFEGEQNMNTYDYIVRVRG